MRSRAAQLDKQIAVLIDDSVNLLKARMSELGITATTPGDLLAKAKEIVLRHKDLQAQVGRLQDQVRPHCTRCVSWYLLCLGNNASREV